MAHLRAHVHDHGLGRDEQRRPRRVGDGRDQHVAGRQAAGVEGVEDHTRTAAGHARAAGDAGQGGTGFGQLGRGVAPFPRVGRGDVPFEHERRHQRVEPVALGPALVNDTCELVRRRHIAAQLALGHQPHVRQGLGTPPLARPASQFALDETVAMDGLHDGGLRTLAALGEDGGRPQGAVELEAGHSSETAASLGGDLHALDNEAVLLGMRRVLVGGMTHARDRRQRQLGLGAPRLRRTLPLVGAA